MSADAPVTPTRPGVGARLGGWLRRNGRARNAMWLIGMVLAVAAIAPALLAPGSPTAIDPSRILEPPSLSNLLGTDEAGADLLSRLIHATQLNAAIAVGSVVLALLAALPAGLYAGYRGRWLDHGLTIVADALLSLPLVLFAVLIVASFGASATTLIGILGLLFFPRLFLLVRGQTRTLRQREFILAAKAAGIREWRIVLVHLAPNLVGPLLVMVPQLMAIAILVEAGLSYLGLGVQPPAVTWGTVLLTSRNYYIGAPWYAISGGVVVTAVAAYLLIAGDLAGESANPTRRNR